MMCVRIGTVTGRGLARGIHHKLPKHDMSFAVFARDGLGSKVYRCSGLELPNQIIGRRQE